MRAFEFIRSDVAIANLPVKMVGGVAGFLSEANGATHQAIEDVSLMRTIPNIGVFCPADEEDMMICLPQILTSPQPFYIRYTNAQSATHHSREFSIGSAEQFGENGAVTILTYGILLRQAFLASKILTNQGISTSVVNLRTLKPIDEETLLIASQRAELVVTLEDHFLTGGLYSILCEILVKHRARANVLPIALSERWFKPGLLDDVLRHEGFTGEQIAEQIMTKLKI
jgi:transketolase